MRSHWYVPESIVHTYMRISGLTEFGVAEWQLLDIICSDRMRDTERRSKSGAQLWRATVMVGARGRQRKTRLDFYVQPDPRPEGPAPQVVRLVDKGPRGRRAK